MKRLALMLLCVGPLAGCAYQAKELQDNMTPVRVAAVKMYQPKEGERYSASITPGRQVVLAFRGSGFVQYLHRVKVGGHGRSLEPGDMVPQGTVLARLRQEDYGHQFRQAQAQAEAARQNQQAAQAQLAQGQAGQIKAQADFSRAQTLFDSQSLTRPDFDAAKAQFDSAEAQVRAARSQLEAYTAQVWAAEAATAGANLSLRDTALVAPFGAAVVQRNVELGMLVAPGTSAYTLGRRQLGESNIWSARQRGGSPKAWNQCCAFGRGTARSNLHRQCHCDRCGV
jgi:multidrug efflux pump subunit AcrA (membrane-fusion protein)